jgi:nucleoside-diphosphate-sugar epimerase
MKIVIFGVSGNLGTSVAARLAREPVVSELVGVSRRPARLGLHKLTHVRADIASDELAPLCRGAHAVVHLAWLIGPERDEALLRHVNVDGSRRVFEAAARARVPNLLYASSVGAYARGPKDRAVDESWPATGIESALYSRQKAEVERLLDRAAGERPSMRVVRMRPALAFKRGAGAEIHRGFFGPLVPRWLFERGRARFVPDLPGLRFQCVHTQDVAEAFRAALVSERAGAFNLAADPVLDAEALARALDARPVRLPERAARAFVALGFGLHALPRGAGWLDLALQAPIMSSERARTELGFEPRWSSLDALVELLEGMRAGAGLPTAPLRPKSAARSA